MDLADKEITAMRELYRLLEPFDQQARMRIANYVGSRLEAEHWVKQTQQPQCQQNIPGTPGLLNYAVGQLGR